MKNILCPLCAYVVGFGKSGHICGNKVVTTKYKLVFLYGYASVFLPKIQYFK